MSWIAREFRRIAAAYESYGRDGGSLMSGAAAYFIGLSLFPLLTVLVACVGWILAYTSPGQNAEQQVMRAVESHVSGVVAGQVKEMLDLVRERSAVGGKLGLVTLLITAIAGFAQFEQAFDRIWNEPPRSGKGVLGTLRWILLERAVAFLMLAALGAIVLVAFFASTVMATIQARTSDILPAPDAFWSLSRIGVSLAINLVAFAALYRYLPKADVPWKPALRGAFLVAIAWEAGRQTLSAFLIGTQYSSAYGIVGTFIGLLVWCYYACTILFLGAEYVQALMQEPAGKTDSPARPQNHERG